MELANDFDSIYEAGVPMCLTKPPRDEHPWQVDDLFERDGARWKIKAISPDGTAFMEQMNATNAAVYWTIPIETLPRKA